MKPKDIHRTNQVSGSGIMCEQRNQLISPYEASKHRNSQGINNVGLMARALLLKHDTNPGDRENAKWQTLQVSTLSIASCVGRILIGIFSWNPVILTLFKPSVGQV